MISDLQCRTEMQKLNINDFNDIRISDRELFERAFRVSNMQCCEYNFPNLFNWDGIYKMKWALYRDWLVIHNITEDIILMPQGKAVSPAELFEISELFIREGKSGRMEQACENYVSSHPDLKEFFTLETNDDTGEYIYLSEKLSSLSGEKLHKKKNLISQFIRNNPGYKVIPIKPEQLKDCMDFNEKWYEEKNNTDHALADEKTAMSSAFKYYSELGMEGIGIYNADTMIAFSMFSRQNSDTYTVHFEKASKTVKGTSQVINWETAKYLKEKCRYINREQDLGDPGLRQAKLSYAPEYILKSYSLMPKIRK
ncbi:MAG: hypothetical protein A2017_02910 [Lentisphaerae bacterium GWF2_44_16]|nr:MAG: hypothetical protein A2017_02910 [Lentisphaerae bacterium GWF2_44_16]